MVLRPKKKAGEEDSDNIRLFHFRVDFPKPLQLDTAYLLSEKKCWLRPLNEVPRLGGLWI